MFKRIWSRGHQFLHYWLEATDAHSLHSPFIFDLYTGIIRDRQPAPALLPVERLRTRLLRDETEVLVTDLGAGSTYGKTRQITLRYLAKTSHNPKISRLLYNLARAYRPRNILELGTNLGLSTLHLVAGASDAYITTMEGCPHLCRWARKHFDELHASSVKVVPGPIEENLTPFLATSPPLDMVYLDANHRYQPTVDYFRQCLTRIHPRSVIIVDDIHWSGEMSKAWKEIRLHEKVSLSVDLFKAGLLFFDHKLKRNHYILQY